VTRAAALGSWLLAACAGAPERLERVEIDSEAERRPMAYSLYTPPGWDGRSTLPLVVFLHGGGDDERVFEEHPRVVRILDAWIADGRLPPFLMVVPDGGWGFWANWHDGTHRLEDWVVHEVVPDVQRRWPVAAGRENLHVMGVSMGGAGTLYMALHHLDRFGSATVWSAPIFDVDQTMDFLSGKTMRFIPAQRIFGPPDRGRVERENAFARLDDPADLAGLSLIVGAGTRDIPGVMGTTRRFHGHLAARGVPHRFVVYRGGHAWRDWARVFPVALCLQLRGPACTLAPDRSWRIDASPTARLPAMLGRWSARSSPAKRTSWWSAPASEG
jgi:enterochelin esterase-like enzyme